MARSRGRNQHRCDRRASANAAGCDQRDGDQGTHQEQLTTVQRSETLSKAACYWLVHEHRRQGHGQVRLVGHVMGLIANDRQRGLGVAPAAGSLRITTYKSDWQISGKRQLPALRILQARLVPCLTCCFGVEPPAGIEPATPSLPWNHQEPLCGPPFSQVAADRRGPSYRFSFDAVMRSGSSIHRSSLAQPLSPVVPDHRLGGVMSRHAAAWRIASTAVPLADAMMVKAHAPGSSRVCHGAQVAAGV